jgi:hypothetical protein
MSPAVEAGLHKTIKEIGECIPRDPWDPVAVGDLDSEEQGTGARRNEGKPQVDLVPARFWFELFAREYNKPDRYTLVPTQFVTACQALAEFQEGLASGSELLGSVDPFMFDEGVKVFEYGVNKYAAWNWLKGMPWSVPLGSALRHAHALIIRDEFDDPESGLSHIGHFTCNVMMLSAYDRWYKQGNDFPSEAYFGRDRQGNSELE